MPSTPSDKLPVLKTVGESLVLPLRDASVIFGYAWPLLIVLIAMSIAYALLQYPAELSMRANPDVVVPSFFVVLAIDILAKIGIGAALAVTWHRYLIEGEAPGTFSFAASRGRMVRYVLWGLASILVFALAIMAASLFSLPLFFMGVTPQAKGLPYIVGGLFYLCLAPFYRYALIFPSAAVADGARLRGVSAATKGSALRLATGSFLADAPCIVLGLLLGLVLDSSQAQTRASYIAGHIAGDLIYMFAGLTAVTFLSLSYRHFATALRHAVLHDDEIASGTYRGEE